jgi:ABC-2 type transport system permease protein
MLTRLVIGAARAQIQMARQNAEELWPAISFPLYTFVSMAVLVYAGRQSLAGYALAGALLMTVGQMGFWVAGAIVAQDRINQILELIVASPGSYAVVLASRTLVLTTIGLVGLVQSWLITRFVFGVHVQLFHPALLGVTLIATVVSAAGTALLASALFSLARATTVFQNALNGPLYLLGGVLVPARYLPHWLQPISPWVFLSWSADLLRDCFAAPQPHDIAVRLAALLALGLGAGALGAVVVRRILNHMRREGTLGLT